MTDEEFKNKVIEIFPSIKTAKKVNGKWKISNKEWERGKIDLFNLIYNEMELRLKEGDKNDSASI